MAKQKIIACEVVIDVMQAILPDDVETETLPMSLHEPWDESPDGECILVPPGETVKLENFMTGSS